MTLKKLQEVAPYIRRDEQNSGGDVGEYYRLDGGYELRPTVVVPCKPRYRREREYEGEECGERGKGEVAEEDSRDYAQISPCDEEIEAGYAPFEAQAHHEVLFPGGPVGLVVGEFVYIEERRDEKGYGKRGEYGLRRRRARLDHVGAEHGKDPEVHAHDYLAEAAAGEEKGRGRVEKAGEKTPPAYQEEESAYLEGEVDPYDAPGPDERGPDGESLPRGQEPPLYEAAAAGKGGEGVPVDVVRAVPEIEIVVQHVHPGVEENGRHEGEEEVLGVEDPHLVPGGRGPEGHGYDHGREELGTGGEKECF